MRITLVIGGLGGGGAERVCVNLANAWVERGHQVTILTVSQNSTTPAYELDARVQRRDVGWPRRPRHEELNANAIAPILRGLHQVGCLQQLTQHINLFVMLRYAILAQTPDVVISHLDITNLRVLAAMHETNVPVIVCEHTDSTRVNIGSWISIRAALYPCSYAVVTPHAESAQWLAKYDVSVVLISNPLVPPPATREECPKDRHRIVSLTRLADEKRPELLVRAFASIACDFPEWDLDIYGDGHLRAMIASLIEKLAPQRIHLCGFTRDPYEVLRNADLFVSTSWVEGFGNSIWEALACGVPVVATEAGSAVRTLLRDGIDGVIVSGDSVESLARSLAALMRDEPRRKAMAGRAAEVVNRYPLEGSLSAWDKLLNEVHPQMSQIASIAV
jgi:GalNAc-alpha-(1->4)-GalNAc-alpha-(1->3)-diNAcBac-PP-undecaprenol alpha-1,4-N-acetyl-D-galactosaminyltransferase